MSRNPEGEMVFDAAALHGRSLSQVFIDFVFEDPEIKRLAEIAVEECPAFSRILRGHSFYLHGAWPLQMTRLGSIERSPVGWLSDPDPPELISARSAIETRINEILRPLRLGELIAWGMSATARQREQISTAIWSHKSFYVKPPEFDVYQLSTSDPDTPFDLQRVWLAVTLERRTTEAASKKLISKEQKTPGEASIAAAVNALYPEGIPPGKSVQIRDDEIRAYQKANGLKVTGPKSIQRYLG